MDTTDTLIIGAGQAGLAISHYLTAMERDHVVIERGRLAERWRSERWNSMRLLTPNWMTRLPGWTYQGPDPDGFMSATEVVSFFDQYASSFHPPVRENTSVLRLASRGRGFVATTNDGTIGADNVVVATGWCDIPAIPMAAQGLDGRVHQVVPSDYRRPGDLPSGGVLVVGASATGVQLADEIHDSGRHVTLAVGRHNRLPRRYRGADIFRWLEVIGSFDKTVHHLDQVTAGRGDPSLQLVGRNDHRNLDLGALAALGVRLVGRVTAIDGSRVSLATDLCSDVAVADRRMARVLGRIDDAIERLGMSNQVPDREPSTTVTDLKAPDVIDLDAAGIRSIIWATGYRRAYPWLDLPILDHHGEIRQHRGITPVPGAYVLGQRFQHHQNSNFIDGVGRDARFVAAHLGRGRQRRNAFKSQLALLK